MFVQSIEIKYETAPGIPPPFCFYYYLKGKVEQGQFRVQLEWVYHHREELTEEEILDEGFTGQDDFHWEGTLADRWLSPLSQLAVKTKPATPAAESDERPFLEINLATDAGILFQGQPQNIAAWEYLLQEFIQGIFETSGKEASLQIRYKKVHSDKKASRGELNLFFATRTIELTWEMPGKKSGKTALDWEQSKALLQQIYILEYNPEAALEKEPQTPGIFLDIGEGVWYEFGKSAQNPPGKTNYLQVIEDQFEHVLKPN